MKENSIETFQLIISGYDSFCYTEEDSLINKISTITKEELETLKPLFDVLSNSNEYLNWTSSIYKYNGEAEFKSLYPQIINNVEIIELIGKHFLMEGLWNT